MRRKITSWNLEGQLFVASQNTQGARYMDIRCICCLLKESHTILYNIENKGLLLFINLRLFSLFSCAGIFKQYMGARNRLYGCRTGPPGYTAWRNWFLGIDSWDP
jgi:hypothetical protein